MKFSGKVGNEPMNKELNFGGDPVRRPWRRCVLSQCFYLNYVLSNTAHVALSLSDSTDTVISKYCLPYMRRSIRNGYISETEQARN